jgi:hypothetical protein
MTMGVTGTTSIPLTRAELVALKDLIDLTPGFHGRAEARTATQHALREKPRPATLCIDDDLAVALARRIIPSDGMTVTLRDKFRRAVRGHETSYRPSGASTRGRPE